MGIDPSGVAPVRDVVMHGRCPIVLLGLVAVVAAAAPFAAVAGQWTFAPRAGVSVTHTDNIGLTPENPEAETVTTLRPGFSLSGGGRRAKLDLNYEAQALKYQNDPDRDTVYHLLGADGSLELLRNRLFLDGGVTSTAQILDPASPAPAEGSLIAGDQTEVTTYGIGPRYQNAIGQDALFTVSYRLERVDFKNKPDDSESERVATGLSSGPAFRRWGWAFDYSRDEQRLIDQPAGQSNEVFEQGRAEINFQARGRSELFAAGGHENNEFKTADGADAIDGDFWEAGVRWRPSRATDLELAGGERFFGRTGRIDLNHRGPRLGWRLGYREDVVTRINLVLERAEELVRDADGNIVIGPGGQPLFQLIAVPTVRDEVSLDRRVDAGLTWESGRGRLSIAAFGLDREFQETLETERAHGASAALRWTLSGNTRVEGGLLYSVQEFAGTDREDDRTEHALSVQHDVSRDLLFAVRYQDVNVVSTTSATGFDARVITVSLDKTF